MGIRFKQKTNKMASKEIIHALVKAYYNGDADGRKAFNKPSFAFGVAVGAMLGVLISWTIVVFT